MMPTPTTQTDTEPDSRIVQTDEELRRQLHLIMIAYQRESTGEGWIDRCIEHLEEAMQLIKSHREEYAGEAKLDTDHIIMTMEAGKELGRQYERYDGDMDWIEFVETRYIQQLRREAQLSPKDPNPKDAEGA